MSITSSAPRHLLSWARAVIGLASVIAASAIISAQIVPLRLVSTAWSPFTNESGRPRIATDLVDAALDRIGIKTSTTIVQAATFTPSLLNGMFDGSAAAWRDAERERVLLYSQPYLENRLVLIGRKGADVSPKSLSALAGKRVAIVGGYSYGEIENTGPTFVRSLSEENSLTMLLNDQAEYVLMDELVVQYLVENYAKEAQSRLQIGTTALIVRPLYLAIQRSRPDAESIVNRFNGELHNMLTDRTYNKMLHVEWVRADVDGDGIAEYIPATDAIGRTEPKNAYALNGATASAVPAEGGKDAKRFYLGGNIYPNWAAVPNKYKVEDTQLPDSRRSTGSLFTFVW